MKAFTLPDTAPDYLFALVYAADIARNPRMAWGLKDEQGRPYYRPAKPEPHGRKATSWTKSARSAA